MTATSNTRRPLRLIMCAALVLGGWACGRAFEGAGPSSTAGSGGFGPASTSGSGGEGGGDPPLTGPGDAGNPCAFNEPRGPDPPKTPCDPASDAGVCDLPPSVCANTRWLVYYVNPQCIDGFCRWDKKTFDCLLCDCMNGGCRMNFTAK